ncbi:MAG: hypothetical protein NT007_14595 [Candidatus Kapabacteria bacterium]|nr:hypothetical protein [Candidatus Kapabacteria bacterium]
MKKTVIILFALFLTVGIINAQDKNQSQAKEQPTQKKIAPKFIVEDFVFAANAINNVEITGAEAEGFVQVKNYMLSVINSINQAGKQAQEQIQIEMPIPIAQAMVTLLQRAKFTGANAEKYVRFVNAIVESSKEPLPETKTK